MLGLIDYIRNMTTKVNTHCVGTCMSAALQRESNPGEEEGKFSGCLSAIPSLGEAITVVLLNNEINQIIKC